MWGYSGYHHCSHSGFLSTGLSHFLRPAFPGCSFSPVWSYDVVHNSEEYLRFGIHPLSLATTSHGIDFSFFSSTALRCLLQQVSAFQYSLYRGLERSRLCLDQVTIWISPDHRFCLQLPRLSRLARPFFAVGTRHSPYALLTAIILQKLLPFHNTTSPFGLTGIVSRWYACLSCVL